MEWNEDVMKRTDDDIIWMMTMWSFGCMDVESWKENGFHKKGWKVIWMDGVIKCRMYFCNKGDNLLYFIN